MPSFLMRGKRKGEAFMPPDPYFEIDPDPETATRLRTERDKARTLKMPEFSGDGVAEKELQGGEVW